MMVSLKNAPGLLENEGVMVLRFRYTGNRKIQLSALAVWEKPVFLRKLIQKFNLHFRLLIKTGIHT